MNFIATIPSSSQQQPQQHPQQQQQHIRRKANSRRPERQVWVNPFTAALHTSVEPNCRVCSCTMNSWDSYFDHIMFDEDHRVNEMNALTESNSKAEEGEEGPASSTSLRSRNEDQLNRKQPPSPLPSPSLSPSISPSIAASTFKHY
ncbi:hypothetical protein H4217_009196 [Coemansia sp. RSA 1939]|nr:hypothetical protein H4217_009196 [Coemansia sp. RSA 1939]